MIKGIFFDLDGVMLDACDIHYNALNKALLEVCGYEISRLEHEQYYNGLPTNVKLNMLERRGILTDSDKTTIWERKQFYTEEEMAKVEKADDKIEMLQLLKKSGHKIACVSNSIKSTITSALYYLGCLKYFDLILSNEDFGAHNKPSPYPYQLAMKKLNLHPFEVIIVEDSPKGIQSARASLANVLEVSNSTEVNYNNLTILISKLDEEQLNENRNSIVRKS